MIKMRENRRFVLSLFSVAALIFAVYFHFSAEEARGRAELLSAENEMVENFKEIPMEDSFLYTSVADLSTVAETMEQNGIHVESIGEEEPLRREHGDVLRLSVKGTASFDKILEMFDIIHEKEKWIQLEFRRLLREGDHLRFEAELRAYRGRGIE